MKKTLVVCAALLLGGCSSTDQTKAPAARQRNANRPAFEVRSVLRTLNTALAEAQGHNPAGFPELKQVEVQLLATTEVDANGQVKFMLVNGGVDTSQTHSTSLTLDLEAPKSTPASAEDLRKVKLRSPIAQAILAAKQAYLAEARTGGGPLGAFQRGDITVEIAFEISDKASAGVDTGDLLPVGLSANGSVSNGKTHTIKLVYGDK